MRSTTVEFDSAEPTLQLRDAMIDSLIDLLLWEWPRNPLEETSRRPSDAH